MALFDTQLGVLANQASTYMTTGKIPRRMGNSHPVIVPYQVFEVKDGSIVIACGNDNQFEKMCNSLNLSFHLNEHYKTNQLRVENRQKLIPKIKQCLKKYGKEDVLLRLEKAGVPAGPINNVKEALEDKQSIARNMKMKSKTGYYLNSPIKFNNLSLADNTHSPQLGEDTEKIKQKIKEGFFLA